MATPFRQGLPFAFLLILSSWVIIVWGLRASPPNRSVIRVLMCVHVDPDVELSFSLISTKSAGKGPRGQQTHRMFILRRQKWGFIAIEEPFLGNYYATLFLSFLTSFP